MNSEKKYIKVEDLKDGYIYQINARNAKFGVWREKDGDFVISRFKFFNNYTFEEYHWDVSDMFGTAKPLQELEKCPLDVYDYKQKDMLEYLNAFDPTQCPSCGRRKDEWMRHDARCPERNKI